MVTRGEVWWHEAPDEGRRPYLILTRGAGVEVLTQVLGVPATTTIRNIATEVRLGSADGMPTECVLTLDNVRTVRKSHLVEHITTLGEHRVAEVCDALGFAVECN